MFISDARSPFPNPAPMALAGAAITTWLVNMINVGWFSFESMGLVLACALPCGGTAQVIAGLMEIPRRNTFAATVYLTYGGFWWSFALFVLLSHGNVPPAFVGWYLFLWGVISFYIWIATFKHTRAIQLIFFTLCLMFFFLAAGEWMGSSALRAVGGYSGLITAALAFYLSAADVINDTYGRHVLPVGMYRRAEILIARETEQPG